MAAQGEHHVDLGTNAFDQTANFSQVTGTVERAIRRANDVDAWLLASGSFTERLACRNFAQAVFTPQPIHGAVGTLPLVFVNGARQEALNVGALWRDATTNHLGNRTRHDDSRQVRIQGGMRTLHRTFGAFTAQLLFGQASHHNRQLMRWQCIGVVQHRCHGQVFTTDRAIDDHLQTFDGGEHIHRTPITACAVMVQDEGRLDGAHVPIASALRFWICFSSKRRVSFLNSGRSTGTDSHTPAFGPRPTSPKKAFISSKRC